MQLKDLLNSELGTTNPSKQAYVILAKKYSDLKSALVYGRKAFQQAREIYTSEIQKRDQRISGLEQSLNSLAAKHAKLQAIFDRQNSPDSNKENINFDNFAKQDPKKISTEKQRSPSGQLSMRPSSEREKTTSIEKENINNSRPYASISYHPQGKEQLRDETSDCIAFKKKSLKALGDNINEVFKKKKNIGSLFSKDLKLKTIGACGSPMHKTFDVTPFIESIPTYFKAQNPSSTQVSEPSLEKKNQIEGILLNLLEEHRAANNSEQNLFNKLNFIDRAIKSIQRVFGGKAEDYAKARRIVTEDLSPIPRFTNGRPMNRASVTVRPGMKNVKVTEEDQEVFRGGTGNSGEILHSRSSKSVSYSEEPATSHGTNTNYPINSGNGSGGAKHYHQSMALKNFREFHKRRNEISHNWSHEDTDAAALATSTAMVSSSPMVGNSGFAGKEPGRSKRKICLKKYHDIINEIDNMKLKITKMNKDSQLGMKQRKHEY